MKKIKILLCLLIFFIGLNPLNSARAHPEDKINSDFVVITPGGLIQMAMALCDNWPTYQDQIDAANMAIINYGDIKGFYPYGLVFPTLCDQASGEAAAKDIVAWSPYVGVIGPMYSSSTIGAAPIFESNGLVMISQASSAINLYTYGPHVFNRVIIPDLPWDNEWGGKWAQWINMQAPAQVWRAEFENWNGRAPDMFAVLTYDATWLLLSSIDQVSYLDGGSNLVIERTKLAAAVRNTAGLAGASGLITLFANANRIDDRYTTVWVDHFDSDLFDSHWSWQNDDPTHWSLTAKPGFMRMITQPAFPMTLWRDIPKGDYEIRTRVLFTPTENYQLAGIIVYGSDGNFLTYGRAFCDWPDPACVGNGIYFDRVENGIYVGSNFATKTSVLDEVYLGLVSYGSEFSAIMSTDGVTWSLIGTHIISFTPTKIGIIASNQSQPVPEIPADFDFFILQYATTSLFLPIVAMNSE